MAYIILTIIKPMPGFAKTLFLEKFPVPRWKKMGETIRWPLLKTFLKQKRISYIDYFFVDRLLQSDPSATEETAFFLCHLFLAAKKGHLCIIVNENQITPEPPSLWQKEDSDPLSQEEIGTLHQW